MAFGFWPSTFGWQHISFQSYSRSPKEGRRASRSENYSIDDGDDGSDDDGDDEGHDDDDDE